MAQNYTRQSAFSDGDTITATLFNDEYNQLVNTFNYSSSDAGATGHRHDGSSGQGGNIFRIGDLDFFNKIEADSSNNRWGFYVEVGGAPVEQLRIQDGAVVPVTDNDVDLGSVSLEFKDLYLDGTANIDNLVADTADINGGTVDGVVIGATTAAAITGTTLKANTSLELATGATVTAILDEDTLSSDSATALATQQSIKAYVDAQVTAQDLDVTTDSGTIAIDLDSETLTVAGGTGLDTSATGNTVTVAIDSTVATLTGTQTLTNKTLTSPDIDGGTIDGVTIGGSSAGAITGTTITGTSFVSSGDMTFGDDDKATFGAGSDLQIYHDGSNSFISDVGTGNLGIRAENLFLQNADGSENYATATLNGAFTLSYDNSQKLATTATGIDVTGTVTADSASVTGDAYVQTADGASAFYVTRYGTITTESAKFYVDDNDLIIDSIQDEQFGGFTFKSTYSGTGTRNRLDIANIGDISFYEDTGTTAKFFWDASAEALGIGTTSPDYTLVVQGDANVNDNIFAVKDSDGTKMMSVEQTSNGDGRIFAYDTSGNAVALIHTNGNSYFNGGNVGIGTSSPAYPLHIWSDTTIARFGGTDTADTYLNIFKDNASSIIKIQASKAGTGATDVAINPDGGNVGIGSATINTFYDTAVNVYGSGNSVIQFQTSNTGTASGDGFAVGVLNGAATDAYIWNRESSNLLFGTGAAEAMRLDASGNLLVGQTSADSNSVGIGLLSNGTAYAVRDGSAAFIAHRKSSDGNIVEFLKDNTTVGSIGTLSGNAYITGSSKGVRFGSGGVIPTDSSGANSDNTYDLGDPSVRFKDLYLSNQLNVTGSTTFAGYFSTSYDYVAKFESTDSAAFIVLEDNASTADGNRIGVTGDIMEFETAGSERMRLDASGNLLIGKTDTTGNVAGISLRSTGLIVGTVSGGTVGYFNRTTSDGTILDFRKDNTTVGSIGTNSGYLYVGGTEGNDAFLSFGADGVRPATSAGAARDAAIDLGGSTNRFKNLYLSGGVYLGGTGAANQLDDYEEGTWTPTLTQTISNPTITYTNNTGTYTKIGRLVYASGVISWSAITAGSGAFEISGLPFTIINTTGGYPQFISSDYDGINFSANGATFGGYGNINNTGIRLLILSNNGGAASNIPTPAASGYMYFNIIYQV